MPSTSKGVKQGRITGDFDTSAQLIIDTEAEISSAEDEGDDFVPDQEEEEEDDDDDDEFIPSTQLPERRSQRRSQAKK